jgi:hypothetical protein
MLMYLIKDGMVYKLASSAASLGIGLGVGNAF